MNNNTLFLRRRSKISLPPADGRDRVPRNYIASMLKNLEALGFTFSEPLIEACQALSLEQLTTLYLNLVFALQEAKGAHQLHQPMYPNFPAQVMAMSDCELYLNALLHYLTDGRLFPVTERKERFPLLDTVDLQILDLGTPEEFERLFGQIAASNTSLSEQDKEDLTWFVQAYGSEIAPLLPDAIPQKENMAFVAGLLMAHTDRAQEFVARFCRTATDVLRLAVAMSGGDVSLATSTRFRSYKRAERDLLLCLLDRHPNVVEDMLRWKGRWIRLGERLHPTEYGKKYPQAAEAFRVLRNDVPVETFNSVVEAALAKQQAMEAVERLRTRPGDFARRLDHLLRLDPASADSVADAFGEVTDRVSTPVLLQVRQHFKGRSLTAPLRVFFPKGNLAKAQAITNTLPALSLAVCSRIGVLCEKTLMARFRTLPPLGKVYVDTEFERYPVPFAGRSASKSFRTLTRGSRLLLPQNCQTLRFFLWWKNGNGRTDIDLSAAMFDAEFVYKDVVSYYNLEGYGGCHSGDIVDAPDGASEFIDITLNKVRQQGARYIVMTLNSYTHQPYCDLPECFAGWMARQHPNSGEIYEPKTVRDHLDLTADTRIAIPLIIDIETREVIWCDMALRRHPRWNNNVDANLSGIALTLQALTHLNKPNLYDLFLLHAAARGELVWSPEDAETKFLVEDGLQFRQDEIASNYLL
ncbi:MAG: cytoplasmic protein [Chthonomonadaceae bacterium]|nr:cytoplasmic protein [Chthonomonadaceae bacterium]